ncbi:hypothetical protein BDA96_02G130000 [Sorghum bicolor]|uniref:Uncharacterized protein n=2 Tax=Sorghum bicolor TaxID=4558 RepID=A0A921RN49_SORBI|nr:hypothetical protein BDA96_02G130000 [Sorghum bicolor]KXG35027.1 hypothetical protein SORBI_3002G123700 [Sorghum bicolor]
MNSNISKAVANIGLEQKQDSVKYQDRFLIYLQSEIAKMNSNSTTNHATSYTNNQTTTVGDRRPAIYIPRTATQPAQLRRGRNRRRCPWPRHAN